jgi:hypothetical protein
VLPSDFWGNCPDVDHVYGLVGDGDAEGRALGEGATDGVGEGAGAVSCVVAWSAISVATSLMRDTTL